jgi:hypothetical protein
MITDIESLIARNRARWEEAREEAENGPAILIATTVTGFSHVALLEAVLAVALTLRGARVHMLACDRALPACLKAESHSVPDPAAIADYAIKDLICGPCVALGRQLFDPLGLPVSRLGSLITAEESRAAEEISRAIPAEGLPAYRHDGIAVGEHAYAGALRYFGRGDIAGQAAGEVVVRRYLEASLRTVFAVRRLLAENDFHSACFHHGIYVPQGLIGEVCRAAGLPLSNWNPSYRQNTFIFSHGDTYHHTLLEEPVESWKGMDWSEERERNIMDYLATRRVGTRDWIWFHEKPDEDFKAFAARQGLDLAKPIVGLLTNVIWDAQLHYRANAFANIVEWVIRTIAYFRDRPDLQLLIRIHPAEIRGTAPSHQPMMGEIEKAFAELPENVFVIPPESPVSTYAAMEHCDSVLIYGTKMGVELTSIGIPVICAGEAWIRNKGLSLDASTAEEYFRHLDALPMNARLNADTTREARKYAYHFFFRRMVPLPFLVPGKKIYDLDLESIGDLVPGRLPGLDVICEGILEGTPYIYPAEKIGLHDR